MSQSELRIDQYHLLNPSELLPRLTTLTSDIIELELQIAMLLSQERATKLQTWVNSSERTEKARDRESDYEALTITQERIKVDGDLRALTIERDLILFLCQHPPTLAT